MNIMDQSKTGGVDVIKNLKSYEDKLAKGIESFKDQSDNEKDKIVKNAKIIIGKEEKALQEQKENELAKSKAKALDDAKKIVNDYEKKMSKLDASFRNNSNKAVKEIISQLLKKN